MQNVHTPNSNNFEFSIFEIITEGQDRNSRYYNHQLNKLYAKYQPMATYLAAKFHLESAQADDILQDGIVLLLKRIEAGRFTFNPEYGFSSFLCRTFQNLAMNANRKQRSFPAQELSYFAEIDREDADYVETYPHIAASCSLEERFEEMLEEKMGYSAGQRLYLALLKNKSNAEGAKAMGYKNEGVFRKKKSGDLKKLRERISDQEAAELLRMAG